MKSGCVVFVKREMEGKGREGGGTLSGLVKAEESSRCDTIVQIILCFFLQSQSILTSLA